MKSDFTSICIPKWEKKMLDTYTGPNGEKLSEAEKIKIFMMFIDSYEAGKPILLSDLIKKQKVN